MSINSFDFLWSNQDTTAPTIVLPTSNTRERRASYTEEEIKDKINHCRSVWKHSFSKENGTRQSKPYLCRIFHSDYGFCPNCLNQRIWELQKRTSSAASVSGESLFFLDTNLDERETLSRRLGKDNYIACPLSDDKVRFIYQAEQPLDESVKLPDISDSAFWKETAMSPIGKNMSGNLGKTTATTTNDSEEDEGAKKNTEINITEVVITGLTSKEDESAAREAYLETMDLDPQTPEEVEGALKKRMQAYIKAAVRRGGTVKFTEIVTQKISTSKIKWLTGKALVASEMPNADIVSLVEIDF